MATIAAIATLLPAGTRQATGARAMVIDIERHNEEQAAVWKAYHEGEPVRVPVTLGVSVRYTLANPEANPRGYAFREFFLDPDVMFEMQLVHQHWLRFHLPRRSRIVAIPSSGKPARTSTAWGVSPGPVTTLNRW